MTEEQNLLQKIKQVLKDNKEVEVPIQVFINLWFNKQQKISVIEVGSKLMQFARENDMNYVVSSNPSQAVVVFWSTEKKLLEEGELTCPT